MEITSKFSQKRKAEKLGFNLFLLNVSNNHFDKIADEAIIRHENEILKLTECDTKFSAENSGHLWDIIFLEEELKALAEMKIIFAYKHFEISLKLMMKNYYKNLSENQMFKWENVIAFLKSKNIDIKKVEHFKEINELREVNNAIKHSSISTCKITIPEFKDKEFITYKEILQFYKRIEESSIVFFVSLNKFIYDDLYEFNDDRLNEIVEKIFNRMEPDTAIKLADKIKSNY